MSSQHTPGPWALSTINDGLSVEGGLAIDHIESNGIPMEVCAVWGTGDGTRIDDETRANACLIATAPDLLALVKQYASECADCDGTGRAPSFENNVPGDITKGVHMVEIDCPDCADIRAVLSKAEDCS